MKYILLLIIPLCFFSCKTNKLPFTLDNSDSTSVTITERILYDTTLIPADTSAWMQALIECDSNGRAIISELKSRIGLRSSLQSETRTEGNKIRTTVKCKCDSLSIYSEFKSRDTLSVRVITKEVAVEVPAKFTWWEATKVNFGGYFIGFDLLILLLLLAWLAWKIFKNFTPQGAMVSTGFSLLGWISKLFKRQ